MPLKRILFSIQQLQILRVDRRGHHHERHRRHYHCAGHSRVVCRASIERTRIGQGVRHRALVKCRPIWAKVSGPATAHQRRDTANDGINPVTLTTLTTHTHTMSKQYDDSKQPHDHHNYALVAHEHYTRTFNRTQHTDTQFHGEYTAAIWW